MADDFRNAKLHFPDKEFLEVIRYCYLARIHHVAAILEVIYAKSMAKTWPYDTKAYGRRRAITTEHGHRAGGGLTKEERETLDLHPESWNRFPDRRPEEYGGNGEDENGEVIA